MGATPPTVRPARKVLLVYERAVARTDVEGAIDI
eukprot:IDg10881t1